MRYRLNSQIKTALRAGMLFAVGAAVVLLWDAVEDRR